MTTYFCPHCFNEIKRDYILCPFCNVDIREYEGITFEDKLINALGHHERETVQRSVWILGHLKCIRAIDPLIKLFDKTDNPYLKREILNTLFEIGTTDALAFIKKGLDSNISIVRKRAQEILNKELA